MNITWSSEWGALHVLRPIFKCRRISVPLPTFNLLQILLTYSYFNSSFSVCGTYKGVTIIKIKSHTAQKFCAVWTDRQSCSWILLSFCHPFHFLLQFPHPCLYISVLAFQLWSSIIAYQINQPHKTQPLAKQLNTNYYDDNIDRRPQAWGRRSILSAKKSAKSKDTLFDFL